ncbi:homospermidine synthase [Nitrosomonas sp. Is37]|uniref:homospermidine synthase n=1 Tax=Nitrosomonas sp. Is37 TaxID=3080535 RepID=UPI00294B1D1B|nr:saccharopine dehydrogenase NADP-binding domain-containing protein [Nitrosomonas sp. Is37]MDV6343118.1 saccharopine dehydrogenase NADP-binding domain-containing protein [Nitrosomonas sp. Is37]
MVNEKLFKFNGKFIFIGFGSVGQGFLPLLLRHVDILSAQIRIIAADERGRIEAESQNISFEVNLLTPLNYRQILGPLLEPGDFLLNVSVNVSSLALIELCHTRGALYLDTCIEPWMGDYANASLSLSERSNYGSREKALALRRKLGGGPTAILCHGVNPGLVSHWVKQALLNIAHDIGVNLETPETRDQWAKLAQMLNISVIQCAERDTQAINPPKRIDEFVNTWSIDGFVSEGIQPAELGWGSHEKHKPSDGRRHGFGCDAAIYLERPGVQTQVYGWTPLEGAYRGFLITHNESISIADYLTVKDGNKLCYRPTVYYAYHPCDAAVLSVHEFNGKNLKLQSKTRLPMDDIYDGADQLGVLLMGHSKGIYWYGSVLSIHEARKLAPYNNATSLQVAAGVLGGVIWAMKNQEAGIIEPDEMPFEDIQKVAAPYLGKMVAQYSDWTPLKGRGELFEEDLDKSDPWQFKNFRVT